MSVTPSWLAAAFAGSLIWVAGAADRLAAEEAATALAPPAARFAALNACRIVAPTFVPEAARESLEDAHYPGGGKLSFAVAAPCPVRVEAFDV